ncbi:hypothetical protein PRIPAC_86065 [Pristionchus pacificus]|uniref:Uncharacterized protein n=1 Tax=Pristionchus pacificus TaxID=54126 RepID=A0A2A6BUB1_PRIPA|nr:hypothetical protein PRIPAC_86065 [Pristionchus pacificus]|eukprot:PDM69500.1 hypothetical protein PRIPAC_44596 [Pristionchus pacificus]
MGMEWDGPMRTKKKKDVYYIQQETYMEIYEIFLEESKAFFINVYPEFSKLAEKERDLIFKDYIVKMKMVEDVKRALQLWGGINK